MKKKEIIFFIGLLLSVTFVTFLPALNNRFVNWDDVQVFVVHNDLIRNFSPGAVVKMFALKPYTIYEPLVFVSLSLDYFFFKLNPAGYHAMNLMLHMINCALVFWFIFLISRSPGISFFTALLFAIHPLHAESVVWVSERKDLLYSLFFFLSLISYGYFIRASKKSLYLTSLICFALSLIAKPIAIALVLLLFGLDYFFKRPFGKKIIIEKIPFILITVAAACVSLACMAIHGSDLTGSIIDRERLFLFSYKIIFYLGKMLLPVRLSHVYPFPHQETAVFIFSVFFFIFLTAIVIRTGRYSRKIIFGYIFFIVMLLPTMYIGLITDMPLADHCTYTSLVGIFYIFTVGIAWLNRGRGRLIMFFTFLVVVAICGSLSFLTYKRAQAWKNSFTLWDDVINNYPLFATPYNTRGVEFMKQGKLDEAEADFRQTIRLDRSYGEAYLNLSALFINKGEYGRAQKLSQWLIQRNIPGQKPYINLAGAYLGLGKTEEAAGALKQAILLNPQLAEAYYGLGVIYQKQGKISEAASQYEKAIATDHYSAQSYLALAGIYARAGNHEKVIRLCLSAIDVDPECIQAYLVASTAFGITGDFGNVINYSRQVLKIDPDLAQAQVNLAVAYYFTRQYSSAVQCADKAKRSGGYLDPDFEELLKPYRK